MQAEGCGGMRILADACAILQKRVSERRGEPGSWLSATRARKGSNRVPSSALVVTIVIGGIAHTIWGDDRGFSERFRRRFHWHRTGSFCYYPAPEGTARKGCKRAYFLSVIKPVCPPS